jgi:hypothetical protein
MVTHKINTKLLLVGPNFALRWPGFQLHVRVGRHSKSIQISATLTEDFFSASQLLQETSWIGSQICYAHFLHSRNNSLFTNYLNIRRYLIAAADRILTNSMQQSPLSDAK